MINILVCGATGFIGRNIVESLSKDRRFSVHAVCHERPSYLLDNVIWHTADLRNPEAVEKIVEGKDVIIQAAATTSGAQDIVDRPYIHVTDNAVMNSYLFRTAFEQKVSHVVFFSCTVMYPNSKRPLKETDVVSTNSMHDKYFGVGNTKVYLEKMCEFYGGAGQTKFTAIRHSNIYGPHDKFDPEKSHVFGATLAKVMNAKDRISVWGTGRESRDLLYVEDLVRFVLLVLEKQQNKFELFNCGYGESITIRDLVKKIVRISGKTLEICYDRTKPTIDTSLSLDCAYAQRLLAWSPRVSLEEGIERTIDWWKQYYPRTNSTCNVIDVTRSRR